MKITNVKSKQLDNTELFEFFKQAVIIIEKYDAAKLNIKEVVDELTANFPNLKASLDKEKSNKLTKVLNELDQKRDALITDFSDWLELMQRFPDTDMAAKAQNLYHYLSAFGTGIARETLLAETTIITNIVDGFTKDKDRQSALETINGSAWIKALGEVNTEFAAQYSNRVTDTSGNNKVESFSNLRKQVITAYNNVTELLVSRYNGNKADKLDVATYETCIADLNQLIAQVNTLAKTSKPKAPKEEDKKE